MKYIKRCYGCGRLIWPWSETYSTEKVGVTHKGCVEAALDKYEYDELYRKWVEASSKATLGKAMVLLGLK